MSKPDFETVVQSVAGDFASYVGQGVSIDPLVKNLDPEVNIENLNELLGYYFVLTGATLETDETDRPSGILDREMTGNITRQDGTPIGVLDFVSLLPHRLRNIDPATQQQTRIFEGEVPGRVDWNTTIKTRLQGGSANDQRYACQIRERTLETDQNLILAALLSTINNIVAQFDETFGDPTEYPWFAPWAEGSRVRRIISDTLDKNVYLSEIQTTPQAIDRRTIQAVQRDRNPLYREAAHLLSVYNRIMRGEMTEEEAKHLLQLEVFAPEEREDEKSFFELYWVFRLLDQFRTAGLSPQFMQIEEGSDLIAVWSANGFEYRMYYDWKGKDRLDEGASRELLTIAIDRDDILTDFTPDDDRAGYIYRHKRVIEESRDIARGVFGWNYAHVEGRKEPDIVCLKLDRETTPPTLEEAFIGEVKYTDSAITIKNGLKQILEYGAYAKIGDGLQLGWESETDFLAASGDPLQSPHLNLGLFVGDHASAPGTPPEGLQIRAFGEQPDRPLS